MHIHRARLLTHDRLELDPDRTSTPPRRFLRRLVEVTERKPQRVTTDQHPPYRRAIRWILGRMVVHRTNPYPWDGKTSCGPPILMMQAS